MHILLVEDDDFLRRSYEMILKAWGHSIETAEHGQQATAAFTESDRTFDVVITDRNMPGMDGIELLSWLAGTADKPPPTLLHSSDDHAAIRRADGWHTIDLSQINTFFPFARFHRKDGSNEYIADFLSEIERSAT